MQVLLQWLICFLINLLYLFKGAFQEWGHSIDRKILEIFSQYMKRREQVRMRECDGMRRDLRVESLGTPAFQGWAEFGERMKKNKNWPEV